MSIVTTELKLQIVTIEVGNTRQNSLSDRSTNRCLTPHYHRHHHRVDFLVLATMVDDLTADGYVGADVVANGLMF